MAAFLKNFIVSIKEGRIAFSTDYQKALFNQFIAQFEGKDVWLTVDPKMPKRSDRQNRYYWLYLNVIAQETGHDPEDIHEWAKGKFLSVEIIELFGDRVRRKKSSTDLGKIEFGEYISKIEQDTGILAPDPTLFQLPLTHEEYEAIREQQRTSRRNS